MTAKPVTKAPQAKVPRWTLTQLRQRSSVLRGDPLEVEAWHTLQRMARWWFWSGWLAAFLLAVLAAYLSLWETAEPVPFVQEEHGIVTPLVTVPDRGKLAHEH